MELFNLENNNQIIIGNPVDTQNTTFVDISAAGAATLSYGARYYRTAATVVAGMVRAQAVYSLNYR
ncbi:Fimbrial protein [compost metagenome]